MKSTMVTIDGVDFVPATSVQQQAVSTEGVPYVLVRSGQAGVFAGYLISRDGDVVELAESRRIYYWAGAATLSQLAMEGTSKPSQCKFPAALPTHTVLGVCEILPVTEAARASIASVKVWSE